MPESQMHSSQKRQTAEWLALGIPGTMLAVFILFVIQLLLGGCSQSQENAGGSGTETEATLSGLVLGSDGRPVASARILLRNGNNNSSTVIDSTRSDSQGRWMLDGIGAGAWSLEATAVSANTTEAQWNRVQVASGWSAPDPLNAYLRPLESLQGVLLGMDDQPQSGVRVALLGRGEFAITDASGYYRMDSLPPGAHWIETAGQTLSTRTGTVDTLRLSAAARLEDFEDDYNNLATALGRWNGKGGWWYAISDDEALSVLPLLSEDTTQIGNHVLHVQYNLEVNHWGLVGFMAYSDTTDPVSWCGSQAVGVRVQGHGKLIFEIQTAQSIAQGKNLHFDYSFSLEPTWQSLRIPLDSLTKAGGLDWKNACDDIRFVNFLAKDTVDYQLDDIYLE